jgi:hypothetical protein
MAVLCHQEKLQRTEFPFTAKLFIVVVGGLLNRYVGKMHESILDFVYFGRIPLVGKATEA